MGNQGYTLCELACLSVLLLCVSGVLAQTCEEFQGQPEFCGQIVSGNVTIPADTTQAQVAAILEPLKNFIGVIPEGCTRAMVRFLCADFFKACTPGVPLAQPVCRNSCEEYVRECSTFFHQAGLDAFVPAANCTLPGVLGLPQYPEGALSVPVGGQAVSVPCRDLASTAVDGTAAATCQRLDRAAAPDVCMQLVSYDHVYVPGGGSQEGLAGQLGVPLQFLRLLPAACADVVVRYYCGQAYRPCVRAQLGEFRLAFPNMTCRSDCYRLDEECRPALEVLQLTSLIPDCEGPSPVLYPQAEFPRYTTVYALPTQPVPFRVELFCNSLLGAQLDYSAHVPQSCVPGYPLGDVDVQGLCAPLVEHAVFDLATVDKTLTFNASWALIQDTRISFGALPRLCQESLQRFLCAELFRNCVNGTLIPLQFPSTTCRRMCTNVVQNCGTLLGDSTPDCEGVGRLGAGVEDYPLEASTFTVALPPPIGVTLKFDVPCLDLTDIPYEPVKPHCNDPLVLNDKNWHEGDVKPVCFYPCPLPFWSESEHDSLTIIFFAMSLFGVPITLVVLVTLSIVPKNRAYPAHCTLCILVPSFMMGVWMILMYASDWNTWICEDEQTTADYHYFKCGFSSWILQSLTLQMAFWWAMISVNTAMLVTFRRTSAFSVAEIVFTHLLCWVLPCVLSALCFAVNGPISYRSAIPFCFTNSREEVEYPLFWGPLTVAILMACVSCVMVIVGFFGLKAAVGESKYYRHVRVFLFLFAFLWIFSYIWAYRVIYIQTVNDDISTSAEDYLICLLTSPPKNNCSVDWIPYPLILIFTIGFSAFLYLPAIVWATSLEFISVWKFVFKNLAEGNGPLDGITQVDSWQTTSGTMS